MTLEDMKALSPADCISIAKSLQNDSDAARGLYVPYHVKSHTEAEQDIEE